MTSATPVAGSAADPNDPAFSAASTEFDWLPDTSDPAFSLKGHYKNLLVRTKASGIPEDIDGDPRQTLVTDLNRIRLSPEFRFNNDGLIHADIDNELYATNFVGTRTFDLFWLPSDFNDLFGGSWDESVSGDLLYRLNLHRFYVKTVAGKFTVTAGRQQIRFGSGRLWNPLDILNPITPTFVEGAEDQKGTDALRVEYYPDAVTEISVVYAPKRFDDELDADIFVNRNTNAVCRIRTTRNDTDVAVLAGRLPRRSIGGIDLASIAADGMLRASLLYSIPDSAGSYIQAGGGYEYTFANGLYVLAEYFYNQHALNQEPELQTAYAQGLISGLNEDRYARLANQFLTLNRHYAGIALGFDITPLIRADIFGIADIDGTGLFLSPALRYNILQDLDLSATVFTGYVFDGASYPSDFQDTSNHPLIMVSAKWYF